MRARALAVAPSAERGGLAPYASCRDSGLPWLGAIPSHWDVRRGKYLFREIDDRTDTGTETLLSLRQAHGLIPHAKVSTKPVTPDELKGYKRIRAGQMVLNRMQASNGMFAVAHEDGLVSPDYAVFQPIQPMEPDYFINLFKTNIYRAKFRQESKGLGTGMSGFLRLYSDRFGAIHVPQPPQDEQRQIVEFVRSYDRRVRRLIRNKRRLIGLLNEQKQAIINRAVTRGLNPAAPMKPTGIDWMPEVPAHWEVRKVKQVASFNPSRTESSTDFDDDDEVVFLPMENVSVAGEVDCSARGKVADLRSGYTYFRRHDVVVAKITPCFENGKGAYLGALDTEIGFGTTEFVVLRANPEIDPGFLYQVTMLHAFRRDGEMAMTGAAGQQRVPLNFMREFMFGLPDLQEQRRVLAFVELETQKINQTIEKAKSEISLVMEYRERLIADVVTGKLDVRHIKITTPTDEPVIDEDDALDEDLNAEDTDELAEAED
ncbi:MULTISPECIES: restriction endonuclease subunit S [Paracoccus]|uniref:Type I restriction enzyme S subunit n=1 Tax=Paracoccus versutus TaxID=34007 RepID=A0A3D9XCE3_PARVE|nr:MULTISPECIES: restriction endonuclease subunit S [Paracoccus]REF68260.1 type I restriction enzyme S subunit [Paracoccus versutus]WGR58928.1 restriction endonuclease subunit S [Paracoccus versutus]SFY45342.1 type I restriction enzyme, S subunit [Paracoccus pantotrophus]